MIPRPSAEEIAEEYRRLDSLASRARHPDGHLTRERFIEQDTARLQLQLYVIAACIDQQDWEAAVRGILPMPGWLHSLAAACVGMMPREDYVDLLRRNEEIVQQRPLKLVVDDGESILLGPDDDWYDRDWFEEDGLP